jgi:hypothetical protein
MTATELLIPTIFFEPGFSLDLAYPFGVGGKASPDFEERWDELAKWIPEIQQAWETKEKRVLEVTIDLLGKDFGRRELSVALILCPLPSMSYPLTVNASNFLKSSENQKPRFYFFSTLHHELLHCYLNENFSNEVLSSSPLLRKYIDRREPRAVISHLHLFAVQKAVCLKLEKEDELKRIIQWNSEADDPAYRRAWEIVNELDGFDAYITELKAPMGAP